ncbi:aminoglycoside phosphotransferase family protein [Demetria terragena]|uniref:aminoglycoside phosphotransferase family protein n=1 Tax=Demetria terragena TaxID=63959 RepID=UPI00037CA466|nr:aminoglycoside phosphotransferase family protein [Demetria terragena]
MPGEVREPDAPLVRRLLGRQYPDLADEYVRPSAAPGSSNWVFRVGDHYAVRLPREDGYVADLDKEVIWLPRLAPELPVGVPSVRFRGSPCAEFSRPWTVVSWVSGRLPENLSASEQATFARGLGEFVRALHAVDTWGQETGERQWGYRAGEPVTPTSDRWVEEATDALADMFDPVRARHAWTLIRDVPPASELPCWVHTDLSAENVLVEDGGRLAGVIDFGGLGVGDRSVDLLYAWSLFDESARDLFREASGVDGATWRRARAWAFAGPGLLTLANYRTSMPDRTRRLTRMVEAVAADVGVTLR